MVVGTQCALVVFGVQLRWPEHVAANNLSHTWRNHRCSHAPGHIEGTLCQDISAADANRACSTPTSTAAGSICMGSEPHGKTNTDALMNRGRNPIVWQPVALSCASFMRPKVLINSFGPVCQTWVTCNWGETPGTCGRHRWHNLRVEARPLCTWYTANPGRFSATVLWLAPLPASRCPEPPAWSRRALPLCLSRPLQEQRYTRVSFHPHDNAAKSTGQAS